MRGCLLSLILIALVVANGYCIWQIQEMRALVGEIHADMVREQETDRTSMIDHGRDAVAALRSGEQERAQRELKRLAELVDQTRTMAKEQRRRLRERLAEAKEAIDRGSARATELVEGIVRDLSHREGPDEPSERTDERQEL
jgi:hypothetical protein